MVSPAAPWPATTGGLVRIAAILDQMSRYFNVTFVSPRRPNQPLPVDPRVRFVCPELQEAGIGRKAAALANPSKPFHVAVYSHQDVRRIIRRELESEDYDVVYGHFFYCMEYLRGTRVPVVIDQQNVDRNYWRSKSEHSPFPLSAISRWNMKKTIAYEADALRSVWGYVSVSEADRQETRRYAAQLVHHFWVAPNGVDTRRFQPIAATRSGAVTLGYLGSMDLQMNVEAVQRFCRTMLPGITAALPGVDVSLLVIGSDPSSPVRKLAAQLPSVRLSGTVPDVVPWLQRVDILVCPLRIGAGTKLKVAEAMSCGLPVVGSSLAFAGLPGNSGEHYVRADSDDEFVSAVCRLVRSEVDRRDMGEKARALAEAHLEWDVIGKRLAKDIQGALVTG